MEITPDSVGFPKVFEGRTFGDRWCELSFYRPDALSIIQPIVSKNWRNSQSAGSKLTPQFFCDQLASGDNPKPNSKLPSYSTAITFQSARRCQTASLWSTREYKMTTFVKNHTGCQPWLRPLWRMSCHTQSSRSAFHSSRRWRPDISSGHGSIAALSLYCPCHLATPANQTNTACCILKNNTTFCILWSEKKLLCIGIKHSMQRSDVHNTAASIEWLPFQESWWMQEWWRSVRLCLLPVS